MTTLYLILGGVFMAIMTVCLCCAVHYETESITKCWLFGIGAFIGLILWFVFMMLAIRA